MSRKTMLIINPVSGKGRVKGYLMDILTALCTGGDGVSVYLTEKRGDAIEFAAKYGAEYDVIACTGGDGSLNEVISGLMTLPAHERPIIGYVPLGTTNDMATSLSIPRTPKEAIARLADGKNPEGIRTVDIGRLGSDYFGYVAAFGVFTDIPFTTPQSEKNTWGYLAYVSEALSRLSKITFNHARVTYDDGYIEDDFILGFVVNSTHVAGGIVKLPAEDVSLDDGLFEVLLVKNPHNVVEMNKIVTDVLKQNFNSEYLTLLHTTKISFEFDAPVQWTRDGEDGGTYSSVEALNFHRAIRIFA